MPSTFENLPQQVDHLLTEVLLIKKILLDKIDEPEEVPKKYLSSKEALAELKAMGYSISWSKFTKMAASRTIPCHKLENKLLFNKGELIKWFDAQIINPSENLNLSNYSIVKSSQNKKLYGNK
ncbi:hypothetical protein [Paludibacter sp.]|uniref:hypothetical protein n=1 Tax=Paludibacter sp. TaxID=1898105 RepID=UPI0013550AD0|nr:hypothetical protein [Paludibacter sp.]MTK53876.1 helix-turn-helix domain-containing protein [Paludibacter sp.]